MRIGTANDVRRLDQSVIADFGIPQSILMENAALAARETISRTLEIEGKDILVICGGGNNGGDGLALARLLYARGAAVSVLMAADPGKLNGAAAENWAVVNRLPLEVLQLDASPEPQVLGRLNLESRDLLVDALFGTGLSREIQGPLALLIERINNSATPVVALDIPSGVNADTGVILGCAIRADATATFGIPKRGNLLYPGHQLCGKLYLSEISFPPEVCGDDSIVLSVNIPPPLPERDPAGHKGSFGKVLIIGGAPTYAGAPALAAAAALKSGAGYAHLAVPADIADRIFPLVPEAVLLPRQCGGGAMGAEHAPELLERAAVSDAVVLGPGLSTDPEAIRLAREIIISAEAVLVVDGDALTALSGREELSREREYPTILTPHPGEMARLLGSSIREVETRRVDCALEAAERYGATVILKGAHSIIAVPSGRAWMNLTGNPGMGTAGSGDILAGLIGTLATSMKAEDAARLGTHLHGLAGDLAAEAIGEAGMTASDILSKLPEALRVFPETQSEDPFSGRIRHI